MVQRGGMGLWIEIVDKGNVAYLVQVHQQRALRAIGLQNLFGLFVKSFHLILGLGHDPLECTQFAWGSTFVEQVDIDKV